MLPISPKWLAAVGIMACLLTLRAGAQPSPPGDFAALSVAAQTARAEGRLDEALALYQKGVSVRPGWAEGWWHLGTLLYEKDEYGAAAKAFQKATTLSPKIGTAWVMLGLCDYKLGRTDAALEHIQRGRQLGTLADPQFRSVMLYHQGLLLMTKGDFERAQETLASLARDGGGSDDLRIALGTAALRLVPSAVRVDDSHLREVLLRTGYAEELAAQARFDEALREYERLTTDFPKERNVHYAFARFLITRPDPDPERAVIAFEREIENVPEHVLARLGIASVKVSLDPAGGLRYAEEAVRLNPHIPLGHYLLGSMLLHTDQTARAIQELETARRAMPDEPRVHYALGRAYARANRPKESEQARAEFRRLMKEDPGK